MAIPSINPALAAQFNETVFRQGVLFAMQMGAAPDASLRPTFVFPSTGRTYKKHGVTLNPLNVRLDRDGKPLDPDVQVIATPPVTKQVDCAIEIQRADAEELPVGSFRPTKAVVTFLDEEYLQVKGCREMTYNNDRYQYGYEPEVDGLFGAAVHTMIFYAIDDS